MLSASNPGFRIFASVLAGITLFPASTFAQCSEKVVWSKSSPDRSIVYQRNGDQTRILVCQLRLVESTSGGQLSVTREFAGCDPINPDEAAYDAAELQADADFLVSDKRWARLKNLGRDTAIAFFVSIGFVQLGQAFARTNAVVGEAGLKFAARMGKRARCAALFMDRLLGGMGKEGFVEGSRTVGSDKLLRFFPAYIGAGVGVGWTLVNELRHGDYRRDQTMAASLDADRVGGKDCEPVEIDMKIEDYSNLIREALRLAREHRVESLRERARNAPPKSREALRERALQTAPGRTVRPSSQN